MKRIYLAGHRGMVGSALMRQLIQKGYQIVTRTHSQLNLIRQADVEEFFGAESLDAVIIAAAKVGGIYANNTYPADFIYENLMIEANLIHSAHQAGISKLLFLGSSCIYPRAVSQPMAENSLLTGALEPTNEAYAIAKIAGIKLCESYNRQYGRDYRSVMPTNLYGPGDNYHPENSHVIPALLLRFHQAVVKKSNQITIWGSGTPKREFLHIEDMARAVIHILELPIDVYRAHTQEMCSHINIGSGAEYTIRELAETIARVSGFIGELIFDATKPDGIPRKLLDSALINSLGWHATINLEDGLRDAYRWFVENRTTPGEVN